MNCQELTRILDEQELHQLPSAERDVAEAHLAGCPDCARDLRMHLRFAALPIPPLAPERIAGWRAACVSGALINRRQRRRSRLIVIGALAAVAAAATMLVARLSNAPELPGAAAHVEVPQMPVVQPGEPTPESVHVAAADKKTAQNEKTDMAAAPAPIPFVVLLAPLQHRMENAVARVSAQQYYAELTRRLKTVPGLVLIDSDDSANLKPVAFRLTVISDFLKVPERFGNCEKWQLTLQIQTTGSGSTGGNLVPTAISNAPDCGSVVSPEALAESHFAMLRQQMFPANAAAGTGLQARFLDSTLPSGVRHAALSELIQSRQRSPGPMDAPLIRGILEAIPGAPNPALRASLWRALRGQQSPELVQPLIDMAQREADDTVRVDMVTMLATDFGARADAHTALEMMARRDSSALVRNVAQRAISGEASWRDYAAATIADTALPMAQRFAPLDWMLDNYVNTRNPAIATNQTNATDREFNALVAGMIDSGDGSALAEVLSTKAGSLVGLRMLDAISQLPHPGAVDLLLASLEKYPVLVKINFLGRLAGNPRAVKQLQDIATNFPDQAVRGRAASALQESAAAAMPLQLP